MRSSGLLSKVELNYEDTGSGRPVVDLTRAGRHLQDRARHVPDDICEATGLSEVDQADLVARLRELAARLTAQ